MPHLLAFVHNVAMHYVYLLKSKKNGRLYTGFTDDLRQRVEDHNSGKSSYTKNNRPYVLVYYEAYASRDDAQKRERSFRDVSPQIGLHWNTLQNWLKGTGNITQDNLSKIEKWVLDQEALEERERDPSQSTAP